MPYNLEPASCDFLDLTVIVLNTALNELFSKIFSTSNRMFWTI